MSTDTYEDRRQRAMDSLLHAINTAMDPDDRGPGERAEVEAARLGAQGALTLLQLFMGDIHAIAEAAKVAGSPAFIIGNGTKAKVDECLRHMQAKDLPPDLQPYIWDAKLKQQLFEKRERESVKDGITGRITQQQAEYAIAGVYRHWAGSGMQVLSTGTARDDMLAAIRHAFEGQG